MWFVYNKTPHGKYMYAIGGNENSAEVSGINTVKTKLIIYMTAGLMYGIAGFLLGAKSGGAILDLHIHDTDYVQYLLGTLDKVHNKMAQVSEKEANQLSVRLELQADFFAGLWANHENQKYASLEDGDIEEGMNAATAIGDDRLQMQAQGYTVPDAFNHGTSKQRTSWLKRGLTTGDINQGDTFSPSYANL